jgi:S-adenosylmethionine:tRNA ribosyltransferase-isomerase
MERLDSSAFDFALPKERIAQRPRPYAEQRLLTYDRATGAIGHHRFSELPQLLRAGDRLVVNDSRVVPAQLGPASGPHLLVLAPIGPDFENVRVLGPAGAAVGETLDLPGARFTVKAREAGSSVLVGDLVPHERFANLIAFLDAYGVPPLPPYIRREADPRDQQDYQTVFATAPGSIAAPTAGLHFHPGLLAELAERGVQVERITLHVGYGTFRQFGRGYVDEHRMEEESYWVSAETARALWQALREGRRVIAVGTTATRTLETVASALKASEPPGALAGESRLFIYPPYAFQCLSGLITNFHYPRTPVLSLTAAFCGSVAELQRIYREALARDYQFYSYGDGMLAL